MEITLVKRPQPPPLVSANTASSHQVQKSHNSSALVMGLAFLFDNAMKSHAIIFLEKLGFCQTCFSPTQKPILSESLPHKLVIPLKPQKLACYHGANYYYYHHYHYYYYLN